MSEIKPIRITVKTPTLCWDCANSASDGCSWAREFIPVPGWEAVPTKIKVKYHDGTFIDSFCVISCPEFKRDATGGGVYRLNNDKS